MMMMFKVLNFVNFQPYDFLAIGFQSHIPSPIYCIKSSQLMTMIWFMLLLLITCFDALRQTCGYSMSTNVISLAHRYVMTLQCSSEQQQLQQHHRTTTAAVHPITDKDRIGGRWRSIARVGAALYGVDVFTARIASAAVIATVKPQSSSSSETILQALPECSDSIIVMKNDLNKQIIVIGTAHISESSVDLVRRTIQKITPDVVMIELDAKRIGRVDDGRTLQELGFDIPEQQKVALLPNIVDNKYDAETRVIKRDNLLVRTSKAVGTMVMASIKQAAGALLGKALGQFYDSVEKLGFTAGGKKKTYQPKQAVGGIITPEH